MYKKETEKEINKYITYIKEGYCIANNICYGKEIRPFDIIIASSNLGKYKSKIIKYLTNNIIGNISGIIINNKILSSKLIEEYDNIGVITTSDLYVWYTVPIEHSKGNWRTGQKIKKLTEFIKEYDNISILNMRNNICDNLYIDNINKNMNKIFKKYSEEKYDFSIVKILNKIIYCIDLYKLLCIEKTNGLSSDELIFTILSEFNIISINPELAEINGYDLKNSELSDIYVKNNKINLDNYIKSPY